MTSFSTHYDAIRFVRTEVFIKEHQIPDSLEWDGEDQKAIHLIVFDQKNPIATARLLMSAKIGRMAVVEKYRKQGIGSKMLDMLKQRAKEQGFKQIFLDAQLSAKAFYQQRGFICKGETFYQAGIPHVRMIYNIV